MSRNGWYKTKNKPNQTCIKNDNIFLLQNPSFEKRFRAFLLVESACKNRRKSYTLIRAGYTL